MSCGDDGSVNAAGLKALLIIFVAVLVLVVTWAGAMTAGAVCAWATGAGGQVLAFDQMAGLLLLWLAGALLECVLRGLNVYGWAPFAAPGRPLPETLMTQAMLVMFVLHLGRASYLLVGLNLQLLVMTLALCTTTSLAVHKQ